MEWEWGVGTTMPLLPTEDSRHSPTSHDLFGVCPPFVVNCFERHRPNSLGSFPYLGDGDPALFKSHYLGT